VTDWPSYCDEDESEIFNSLPDEVELVEKSYADALEKEIGIHLQNALAAKEQLEELSQLQHEFKMLQSGSLRQADELSQAQSKISKLEGELRLSKNITVQVQRAQNALNEFSEDKLKELETIIMVSESATGVMHQATKIKEHGEMLGKMADVLDDMILGDQTGQAKIMCEEYFKFKGAK
jgi:predicted  nucleic acid-binding Zn-ribbon protein